MQDRATLTQRRDETMTSHSRETAIPAGMTSFGGAYPRFMIYSPDTLGFGHLSRCLALSSALVDAFPASSAVVATGSPWAAHLPVPVRVKIAQLPPFLEEGQSRAAQRRRLLLDLFHATEPQVLIVDDQLAGLHGEVAPLLFEARLRGIRTVLGVPDIPDRPGDMARALRNDSCRWALAEGYDRVCVYGAPEVFDPRSGVDGIPELAERAEWAGYLAHARVPRPGPTRTCPHVLVALGGGPHGEERAAAYFDALALGPVAWSSTLVSSPRLAAAQAQTLRERASQYPEVTVEMFGADLTQLLAESDAAVAIAGYNTAAAILASRKPAVLLPWPHPTGEQLLRAERFEELGLVRTLRQPAAAELRRAVEAALAAGNSSRSAISAAGGKRMASIASELLGAPGAAAGRSLTPRGDRALHDACGSAC